VKDLLPPARRRGESTVEREKIERLVLRLEISRDVEDVRGCSHGRES
jgi:hypothetical protein